MRKVNRRNLLASMGALGGAAILPGCGGSANGESPQPVQDPVSTSKPAVSPSPAWRYIKLDPDAVARRAYEIYPEGGCMYAVVGSVIGMLAEKEGEPYRSFPVGMMRYGRSGVGSWGSLCGVVNGAAALIGIFHSEEPKEERDAIINEFAVWYESETLPVFKPAKPYKAEEIEPNVAGSLLCHISANKSCQANSCQVDSAARKERCQRLAADGARKVAQLLNRAHEDDWIEGELTDEVYSCNECHGKKNRADASVKMNCATCHQFEYKHY